MTVLIDGTEYWLYEPVPSWDGVSTVPNIVGDVTDAASGGTPLVVRDPETELVVSPTTSAIGLWPQLLVNAATSWWSSGGGPRQFRVSRDLVNLASEAAAAQAAAEDAQAAAEAAQAAAEAAEGPAGPAGSPYPILTYDGAAWPTRPVDETGPVVWFLPVTESTWPGDPAGVAADDLLDVPSGVDPTA